MLTKYGTDNIIVMLAVAVILFVIPFFIGKNYTYIIFITLSLILAFFTFWFFRDPDRNIPISLKEDEALIVSPCDGKVLQIIDAKELIIEIKKIDDDTIKIMLRFFDGKNLKLDKILERLLNLRENEVKILYTKRNNLFIEGNGTIYEI